MLGEREPPKKKEKKKKKKAQKPEHLWVFLANPEMVFVLTMGWLNVQGYFWFSEEDEESEEEGEDPALESLSQAIAFQVCVSTLVFTFWLTNVVSFILRKHSKR